VSPDSPSCPGCGAALASDQEYCLSCGARRLPQRRPARRGPVLAAIATVLVALAALALAYRNAEDDAEREAGEPSPRTRLSEQAQPSVPAGVPDAGTPAPPAPPGATQSR
jgi:hypothetical protein